MADIKNLGGKMSIKTEFKPNKLYLSLLNNIKKIKITEPVTPYDVVIASTYYNIREIIDYHERKGVYKK